MTSPAASKTHEQLLEERAYVSGVQALLDLIRSNKLSDTNR